LKGEFTIKDPKTESSCGEKRRNIIDLKFTKISSKRGFISTGASLPDFVDALDRGEIRDGINSRLVNRFNTGDLWNLYVDNDLRICYGIDDGAGIDAGGMFVLIRQEFVNG
jgi:hypothetical protein